MAVDAPQIRIDPYTSTVPTVSIPPQEMDAQTRPAAPLQGEFGKKGTGALAIGDSIVKGLIQGHQYKEQKKAELANATIATADKDTADAYQQYQDALTQNKPSAETQTAYQNYLDTFNRGKEAKAKFVIPEKGQKSSGQKKDKGVKGAAEGMAGGIKEWFAANPHVIPSLAILSMQPKPPGASPQTTAQKAEIERQQQIAQGGQIELDNAKQAQSDRNTVAQYASLTPDEVNALPEDEKKKLAAAQSRLAPAKGKTQIWRDGSGNILVLPEGTQPPTGYTPYEKSPTNESVPNELLDAGAKALGKSSRSQLTFSEMNAILGMEARQKAQASGQTTYSYSTVDASGNRSTRTRKISDPISPEEQRIAAALGGQQGGIQAPPAAPGGTAQKTGLLNPYRNPEDQPPQESYALNQQWAKPGPYSTMLAPDEEQEYRQWAAQHPKDVAGMVGPAPDFAPLPTSGYDSRGWFHAMKTGDPSGKLKKVATNFGTSMHGSDKFKTPYNGNFSNESMYATPDAPRWNGDRLVTKDGRVVVDETPKGKGAITAPPTAPRASGGGIGAPPQKITLTDANRTAKVETEKAAKYHTAETNYRNTVANNNARITDSTALTAANNAAKAAFDSDEREIRDWYTQQVHAIGGKMPWEKAFKQHAKDAQGNVYGSDDGTSWVNIKNGEPYKEQ